MPKKSNAARADGIIAVQVYFGRVDSKRKYKTVYGKKQAKAKADAIRAKLGKGLDISAQADTFRVFPFLSP